MEQSYTDQDLIRFIYKEVDLCEYFEMDFAINNDSNLKENYLELKESFDSLPKVSISPSTKSIQNILKYNKRSFVDSLV